MNKYIFIVFLLVFISLTVFSNNAYFNLDKISEIKIDNKIIKFIPENNIPNNVKIYWVKNFVELKKIINEIESLKLVHSKSLKLYEKSSNALKLFQNTHYNYLFDIAKYKNRWNQTVLEVVLTGQYFYNDNKKVTV
ncbi:hypothetical protein [Marinitoga lauensis]|uniref:hypothetical protein n=1 Tax=Marinitoga lauensis TaxID=2201189 RepID=UPI001012F673|nr:hypothetical protein [Marinitoga lauensis]